MILKHSTIVILFLSLSLAGIGNAQLRTVALSEDDTGTAPDEFFTGFALPVINDLGRTSFRAFLQNPGGTLQGLGSDHGIWSDAESSLQLVTRANLVDGGAPMFAPFSGAFSDIHLNNAGTTIFLGCEEATFRNGSLTCGGSGVWQWNDGNLTNSIPGTDQLPGAVGESSGEEFVDATRNGRIAFMANLSVNNGNTRGLWSNGPDGNRLVVLEGQMVPTISNGDRRFSFNLLDSDRVINSNGAVAFGGRVSLPNSSSEDGIWIRDQSIRPIVLSGEVLPGTNGLILDDRAGIESVHLSDHGEVVFEAELDFEEFGRDAVILASDAGNFRVLAREGSEAPGGGTFQGVSFSPFSELSANAQGDAVFLSSLSDSSSSDTEGVFVDRGDGLEAVFRDFFPRIEGIAINNNQQVAFASRTSIMAETADLELIDIVSLGDEIEVSQGDIRVVTSLAFAGELGFNDLGQIAFRAGFQDGSSGVFVSNAVAVPEPSVMSLGAVLIATGWYSLRRRREYSRFG